MNEVITMPAPILAALIAVGGAAAMVAFAYWLKGREDR